MATRDEGLAVGRQIVELLTRLVNNQEQEILASQKDAPEDGGLESITEDDPQETPTDSRKYEWKNLTPRRWLEACNVTGIDQAHFMQHCIHPLMNEGWSKYAVVTFRGKNGTYAMVAENINWDAPWPQKSTSVGWETL